MPDPFASFGGFISLPAEAALPILPSDTDPIAQTPKAVFIGTGGTLVARGINASVDVTFRNLPAGSILPFRPGFIRATGTTAGELLALY